MTKFFKSYLLIASMILGVLLYKPLVYLKEVTPFLIFSMLLLSYSRLSFSELKIKQYHLFLLVTQIISSVLVYLLLFKYNIILAQAAMICILIPTASAAVVVTKILGGNIASLTSFSLLSNFCAAVISPVVFSFVSESDVNFIATFWKIISKVGPILLLPFILAAVLRRYTPKLHSNLLKIENLSLYLWSLALMIATSNIFILVKNHQESNMLFAIMALVTFIICIMQFYLGRKLGKPFNDTIAMGQSAGQKNTILGIWMAQSFLNPLASAGPGAYVVWQTIVNSYQMWTSKKE